MASRSLARILKKKIRGNMREKVINVLGVVPVVFDGAKEAACTIVAHATALLFFRGDPCFTERCIVRVTAVEPFSYSYLQPACIIAARVICTTLQLLTMSDQREE